MIEPLQSITGNTLLVTSILDFFRDNITNIILVSLLIYVVFAMYKFRDILERRSHYRDNLPDEIVVTHGFSDESDNVLITVDREDGQESIELTKEEVNALYSLIKKFEYSEFLSDSPEEESDTQARND